jgi:putative redox protein
VKIRGHEFITDIPVEKGGKDAGPTPTELFVASIGACVGLYGARYLRTAKLDPSGLSMKIDWDFSEDNKRVGRIDVAVSVPNAELGERKRALILAMEKCVIHNTLHDPPEIKIDIVGDA